MKPNHTPPATEKDGTPARLGDYDRSLLYLALALCLLAIALSIDGFI